MTVLHLQTKKIKIKLNSKWLFYCDTSLQIHIYFSVNVIHSVSFNISVFQIFPPTESVCLINVFPDV